MYTQEKDHTGQKARDCRQRKRRTRYDDENADRLQDFVFDKVARVLNTKLETGSSDTPAQVERPYNDTNLLNQRWGVGIDVQMKVKRTKKCLKFVKRRSSQQRRPTKRALQSLEQVRCSKRRRTDA